jgi:hypothetical protein
VVFFAPVLKRCWTDHPSSKKTVGIGKQVVSKQAHLSDIGGEFKKWGKIPQKKSFFSSRWGISTTFDA